MFSYTASAAKKGPSDLLQQLWLCWGTEMMLVGVKVGHQTSQTAAAQALCSWRGFNNRFAMMDKDISCDNDDVGAKLSLILNNRLAMHCLMYKNISCDNQWSTMMILAVATMRRCWCWSGTSQTGGAGESHQLSLIWGFNDSSSSNSSWLLSSSLFLFKAEKYLSVAFLLSNSPPPPPFSYPTPYYLEYVYVL